MIHNYEFKARVDAEQLTRLEERLGEQNPRYVGEDHQIDTYFCVDQGRLKLRQGNIENSLIRYERQDIAGSKLSKVLLYKHDADPMVKAILESALGIDVVVDKRRRIYFVDHVKFHFDRVEGLGTFLEVEAIDDGGKRDVEQLKQECNRWADFFELDSSAFVDRSYSDLVRETKQPA